MVQEQFPAHSESEMIERASEGYFVRDTERDVVNCPAGNRLFCKSLKKNGYIRYANKTTCKRCPHNDRCFSSSSIRTGVKLTSIRIAWKNSASVGFKAIRALWMLMWQKSFPKELLTTKQKPLSALFSDQTDSLWRSANALLIIRLEQSNGLWAHTITCCAELPRPLAKPRYFALPLI